MNLVIYTVTRSINAQGKLTFSYYGPKGGFLFAASFSLV